MKKFLLFFLLELFCITYSQDNHQITDRIIYTVQFEEISKDESGLFNYLNPEKKKQLINQLCDLVRISRINACYYWGDTIGNMPDFHNELHKNQAEEYFSWNDTLFYEKDTTHNKGILDMKRNNQVYRYLIKSLSFLEKWHFDNMNNTFVKKVAGVILFQDKYTNETGMKANYYLPLNDSFPNKYSQEHYVCEIIYDVPITKQNGEQLNDYNWWYNYLEASKREKLFRLFTYKALYDTLQPLEVYKGVYPYDSLIQRTPYFNTGLSGNYFYGRSNWYNSDPLMFGMTDLKIQVCCFELSDWTTIIKLRFHEKWYFDQSKLSFEKKVLGIGMVVNAYNDEGLIIGEKCPIYYKLQDQ